MDLFDVIYKNVCPQRYKNKMTMKRLKELFQAKGFKRATLYDITKEGDVINMEIGLPPENELAEVESNLLRNIQQEFQAADGEIVSNNGKFIKMRFGMRKLSDKILWDKYSLIPYINTLKVEFPSCYGNVVVDFEKSISCHGLIGGTAGFGKTVAINYILTQLYIQNSGDIEIHISSVKLDDFYPFFGCKNIYTSENVAELEIELTKLQNEYQKRKKRLRSLVHANDSKSVKKRYPEEYKYFKPIFLFIDEFGRLSKHKELIALVEELVETCRYVNIHVFTGSQRVDSLTVLTPRIRINLSFRLGFWVENKANSKLMLGKSGAERLPKIAGRGILIDKEQAIVQIPFLDLEDLYILLKPFRKCENNEIIRTRQADNSIPEEIQSNEQGSIGDSGMSKSCINERTDEIPGSCDEQNSTTFNPEWLD